MSHVLHVVVPGDRGVDESRFITTLVAGGHWTASHVALRYENRDTGVEAVLEPFDPPPLPPGYAPAGMALVLNYGRASFWCGEVLPSFVNAVSAAGLLVLDPQSNSEPHEPDLERLQRSWDAGNLAAIRAARDAGTQLPWMSPDRARVWWEYQRALPQLRLGFAPANYVPSIRLIRHTDRDEVERAMSWPDFVPTLMPECDAVILMRSDPVRRFEIRGVASAGEVRDGLAAILEQVDVELPEPRRVTLLPEGRSGDADRLLASASLAPFEGFVDVPVESLVDVPPDGRP